MTSTRLLCFLALSCASFVALPYTSRAVDAETFLREAFSKYAELHSYVIEFVRYDEMGGTHSVHHRRISFSSPSYYRIEDLEPPLRMDNERSSACARTTDIIDGKLRWSYSADLEQYSSRPIDYRLENPAAQLGLRLPQRVQNVAFAPDESVSLGGTRYDCTVVEASASNGSTLRCWIDKSRGLPVQWTVIDALHRTAVKIEIHSIEMNLPLKPDLFVFTPPAGWRQSSVYPCSTHTGTSAANR